jgi:hypothetical protein
LKQKEKKTVKKISINQGVRQGCPLLPTLFSLYADSIIKRWQIELKDTFYINNIEINTLLCASDQVILANSEDNLDNLHRAIHRLNVIILRGKYTIRIKIVINE